MTPQQPVASSDTSIDAPRAVEEQQPKDCDVDHEREVISRTEETVRQIRDPEVG
jgi:hypothetical protein